MSKPKYKKGRRLTSVADFENSKARYFKVLFGFDEKTLHRGFVESWQYHLLKSFIHGGLVYEADFMFKKDIPMKPVKRRYNKSAYCCPECGFGVWKEQGECERCGRPLDWKKRGEKK